jgi:hypothetical protein
MEVVEDINEATVNDEFYVELAFLEEWLANPKYDRDEIGYGKFFITAAEEEPNKNETIEVVKVIATMKEEMKENKDVFELTEVDINVKSIVVEVQTDALHKDDEEILKNMTKVTLELKKKRNDFEYKVWRKKKKKLVEHIKYKLHQHEVKKVKMFFFLLI